MVLNQHLFNIIITKTYSNKYFHSFLLLFEYIIFIFPFFIETINKIQKYLDICKDVYIAENDK